MDSKDRAAREAFVQLADTLVADFDVIDFLTNLTHRAVDLLEVAASGLLLADHRGVLSTVAASTDHARLLELFQLQNAEGPCLEAFHDGEPVECPDLTTADDRWPTFAPAARDLGYVSVQAMPMRLRDQNVGAMSLFGTSPGPLHPDIAHLGQALADVATIGIVHERTLRRTELLADQLQSALDSRVLIEQAKGVLAERHQISVGEAFQVLKQFSRNNNIKLRDVAHDVVAKDADLTVFDSETRGKRRR